MTRRFILSVLSCLAALTLWSGGAMGGLLEVTHSPVAGQYGSVNAALAVATTNDVIEIIDNSLPFIGSVAVDGSSLAKNNLVIRGKAGLNPRPTIQGSGVASPFDGGVRAVFTYNNAVDNLQVQDLIFQGTASDDVICDARFWNGAGFTNCDFLSVGGWNALRSQVATTFTNCKMTGANNTVEHFFGGPLILDDCTVSGGPDNGMNISGGQVVIRNKSLISCNSNTSLFIHGEFAGNNPNVQITNSIVTHGSSGGGNLLVINNGSAGAGVTTLAIDNSDLIGDVSNYPANSITGAGIILNTTVAALSVTDTIFFNISSVAYVINGNTAGIANFENYNAFKRAPNNLQDQGLTRGTNNVYLTSDMTSTGWLYSFEEVGGTAGDYRLEQLSQAATLNSTGTPAYAGSQGLHPTFLPVGLSAFELQ
jgi:hypothetical protein